MLYPLHYDIKSGVNMTKNVNDYNNVQSEIMVANSPGLTRILRVSAFDLQSSGLVLQSAG